MQKTLQSRKQMLRVIELYMYHVVKARVSFDPLILHYYQLFHRSLHFVFYWVFSYRLVFYLVASLESPIESTELFYNPCLVAAHPSTQEQLASCLPCFLAHLLRAHL